MNRRHGLTRGAPLVACLALTACQSAPTRLYTLYPVPPSSVVAASGGPAVRIDAVHVPPDLDRVEVLGEVTRGELRFSDLDHWAAPLGQLAKEALSADLLTRLPRGRLVFPHLVRPDDALGVAVDILEFKAGAHGATLEVSWAFTSNADPAPPPIAARLTADASESGSSATAQVFSELLAQLADHIVATLPAAGAPNP